MFSYPPFSLTKPMYDMDTYTGRIMYFFSSINPLLCFQTERQLLQKRLLLDRVAAGEKVNVDDKTLWRARTAIENCVHPTTGETLFPLFRFCAFLPMNAFYCPFYDDAWYGQQCPTDHLYFSGLTRAITARLTTPIVPPTSSLSENSQRHTLRRWASPFLVHWGQQRCLSGCRVAPFRRRSSARLCRSAPCPPPPLRTSR
ncbi:tricarboxylate carrier [Trypanosoma rangeli SC58]|uniref:Tricarboxylate carrier n=1 Tax=Trypanosoma rangeli SC58 TaxID=429131 RepID=A0A061J740_TRYRA|nr:tricarboxylate carrier [Trypanosoma rangeli SC58]